MKEELIKIMNREKGYEKVVLPKELEKPLVRKAPLLSDDDILKSLTQTLKYESKWALKLIRHCQKGSSIESFCAISGLSPSQVEKWQKEVPEFQEACRMAQAAEIYYWESTLQEALIAIPDDETGIAKIDNDLVRICKFKLESLGYGNKVYEANKILFKEAPVKNKKKIEVSLKAEQDLAAQTEKDIDDLADIYLGEDFG